MSSRCRPGKHGWRRSGRAVATVARCFVVAAIVSFAACWSSASSSVVNHYIFDPEYPVLQGYSYGADRGESNQLSVHSAGGMWVFSDPGAAITVNGSAPCSHRSPSQVACAPVEHGEPETALGVGLRDGDDTADLRVSGRLGLGGGDGNDRLILIATDYSSVSGDDGDDVITAGAEDLDRSYGETSIRGDDGDDVLRSLKGPDSLYGGDGSDLLIGSGGNDELSGDRGRDVLRGGNGNDRLGGDRSYGKPTQEPDDLRGGPGKDTVSYRGNVRVTLDGRTNDGAPGERDLVRNDVENIEIQRGTAVGNGQANTFHAENGTLIGGAGADVLSQLPPYDVTVLPRTRSSRLFGGSGADRISTGGSRSTVYGGAGNDRIDTTDSPCREGRPCARDRVSCGSGRDKVTADRRDIVASDCE